MDPITLLGIISVIIGIIAGAITLGEYLQKKREDYLEKQRQKQQQKRKAIPKTSEKPLKVDTQPLRKSLPSPPLSDHYDIFINHRSRNKVWVETLAHNLTQMGYQVFLDIWVTKHISDPKTYNTLQQCNKTILVATPEAIESGWVREEYDLMLNRQQKDRDFTFIPVVFNDALADCPFLSDITVVNFSTADYFEAFQHLVSHLGDKSFDKNNLELPPKSIVATPLSGSISKFIEMLFTQFEQNSPPPLMLLAQMDRSPSQMIEALLAVAKTRYTAKRCLHLTSPYSKKNDIQSYFSGLAQQCGFSETVNNDIEFAQALRASLNQSNPLFLLISRFEHSAESCQQKLAGILRSLNETHADQLHIVLCGGEKLAELKYLHGNHSLLNVAQDYQWAELERADVYAMRDNSCQNLVLTDEIVDKLLTLSGGHPTLLQKCLQLYQDKPTLEWQDYPAILSEEHYVWQLFAPLTRNRTEAKKVHGWLKQEDIISSSVLFSYNDKGKHNEILRRLYWKNMLVERHIKGHKRLCWRCEAIRLAGREILG
jgi:hypothetical protein